MQSSKDTTQKSGISSSTSTNIGGLQTSTQTHLPSLSETLGLGRKDKQQQQQQQSQQQSQQDQGPPASETGTGMGTLGVGLGLGPRGEHSAAAPASASASSSAQRSSQQQQQQATTSSSSSQQAQSSQQPHTVVTTTTTAPAQSKQESYPAGASSSSSSMQTTQRHEQQTQQAQAQPLVYSQAEQPQVYRAETSSGAPEFAEGQGPTVVTYRQTTVATWPGEAPKPAEKIVEVVPVPLAPPGRLDGKVCVITGGTSGIGLSTARLFRDEGARVVITSKCDSQECAAQGKEDVKSKCEHEEGFDVVPTDVRVLEEIDALYRHVQREYGGIDVLFANAGIALFKDSKQVDDRFFDAIMDTNVKGTFFTVTKAMPLMNEGSTVIINSSNVSEMGWPGGSVYAASKAAVRSFARTWTLEVPPHRTRFNVLSPGAVETPLLNRMGKTQEEVKEICDIMMQKIPAKRFASPEEIARIALFMAGDESKYIVGAEICADGGWTQV